MAEFRYQTIGVRGWKLKGWILEVMSQKCKDEKKLKLWVTGRKQLNIYELILRSKLKSLKSEI